MAESGRVEGGLLAVILDVSEQFAVGVLGARYSEMMAEYPEGEGASRFAPFFDGESGDDDEAPALHEFVAPGVDLRCQAGKGEASPVDLVDRNAVPLELPEALFELCQFGIVQAHMPGGFLLAHVFAKPGGGRVDRCIRPLCMRAGEIVESLFAEASMRAVIHSEGNARTADSSLSGA